MTDHAHNLHVGGGILGASLISAIMVNDASRKQAKLEAEAEANSVASVRRLAAMLAAAQRENAALRGERAALATEVEGLRDDLECAHAALRRML
jgi:cell division protein FtsB